MISFVKKTDPQPLPKEVEDNRFEQIRRQRPKGIENPTPMEPTAASARRPRTTGCFENHTLSG